MVKSIIWSEQSLDDIKNIAEFISRDSQYHAQRVIEQIIDIVELISHQPQIGRIVPELEQPNIREQFIYSYRIIYEIKEESINVLTVIHGRRLLENFFDSD